MVITSVLPILEWSCRAVLFFSQPKRVGSASLLNRGLEMEMFKLTHKCLYVRTYGISVPFVSR